MSAPAAPTVSVCIANYNGMGVIDACLRSVLGQDWEGSVEIIVHDDRSGDDSPAYVRTHFPEVLLIESAENVGFCVANNRMVARARGEYVLLLNNDAELLPDALRILHEAATAAGVPCILGLPQYDAADGRLIDIGSLLDPFLNPVPNLDPARGEVAMVIGACLWLPRSLWHELGGFPEWFHTLAEDMYLCCAARLRGIPVRALGASGFRHWVGASLGGGKVRERRLVTSLRRRRLSERNKTFVMVLTYPTPALWLALPLHLLLLGVEGLALSLARRDFSLFREIYWNVFASLWRERARLRAARHEAQASRRIGLSEFLRPFGFLPHKLRMLLRHGLPELR